MFYLAPPAPRALRAATLAALALALAGAPAVALAGLGPGAVAIVVAPAALLVWLVHPAQTALALRRRKRRRVDASVRFWWAGLACTPAAVPLAAGMLFGEDGRWSIATGVVLLWGSAGLIVHGMLSRIVPFLVWFHRFSPLVGVAPVPSMRALLPEPRIRVGLVAHVAALVAGLVAVASGTAAAGGVFGVLVVATGAVLGANLIHTLRRRPGGR
jgi:hypothetical protein